MRNNKCDYHIGDKCDGTLRGKGGTPHKVYSDPKLEIEEINYACIYCEMCFDED